MAEQDERFKRMHTDPRFQKLPKSKLKLPIDARFKRMLTEKAFDDPFGIDKRGKPTKSNKQKPHTLGRYYMVEDEEEQKAAPEKQKLAEKEEEPNEEEDVLAEEKKRKETSSPSESEDESSSESDDEPSAVESEEEEEESKVATTQTETRRLAAVNMDWSCIKALDLLVLFNSFIPKGGSIDLVVIYPSQFGLEEMKKELQGPGVYKNKKSNDNEEVDAECLRKYEKSKLKYYFAVVTCDTPATALALYNSCDGMEFERTSNMLDLQFIPDDMEFKVEPRDTATEVADKYEAPEFQTSALQLSTVKLTWDDDEPVRVKQLRRKFTPDQLLEMDFKDYLASEDEEEESEVDEAKKNKLRSLLSETNEDAETKDENDMEMEITFSTGLDELSKKFQENKEKANETVWEARLRKNKEKKAQRKMEKKETDVPAGNDGFDDPFFNEEGQERENSDSEEEYAVRAEEKQVNAAEEREKKKMEREQKERTKAELELLLLDAEHGKGKPAGENKQDNKKRKKNKKRKAQEEDDPVPVDDLQDPRFAKLFNTHHFAVDPTNPQFNKWAASKTIGEMQQKRFKPDASNDKSDNAKQKAELSSMVKSLKRKSGRR